MVRPRLALALTIGLGVLYLVLGGAETVRAVRSGDGGLWFWFGSLVGGGTAVLAGVAVRPRHPRVGPALICVGSLMGILATSWTIVVPLLALAVVALALQEVVPR